MGVFSNIKSLPPLGGDVPKNLPWVMQAFLSTFTQRTTLIVVFHSYEEGEPTWGGMWGMPKAIPWMQGTKETSKWLSTVTIILPVFLQQSGKLCKLHLSSVASSASAWTPDPVHCSQKKRIPREEIKTVVFHWYDCISSIRHIREHAGAPCLIQNILEFGTHLVNLDFGCYIGIL